MRFLRRVQRQAKQAVQAVRGFQFNQSQYENASSLAEALDLFYTNVLRSLREVLSAYGGEVAASVSGALFLKSAVAFCTEMESVSAEHVQSWVVIAKEHMSPKTAETRSVLLAKQKEFAEQLEAEFGKLRARASAFLKTAAELDLDQDESFQREKKLLEIWSVLTFTSFSRMLQSGDVPWLDEDSND